MCRPVATRSLRSSRTKVSAPSSTPPSRRWKRSTRTPRVRREPCSSRLPLRREMDGSTMTADHGTIATDTLQLAPGVFVAWGGDDPRIGHVDRPFDLFEVSADMVALLARFTQPSCADMAFEELAVGPDSRDAVLAALIALRDAGVLIDPDAAFAAEPLRDAGFEAARATSSCPDIALADPDFTQLYRNLAAVTLTSPQLAYALRSAVLYLSRSGVVGDIVECGVWRGGSMALAATTLLQAGDHHRQLWLYDTFDWQWEP